MVHQLGGGSDRTLMQQANWVSRLSDVSRRVSVVVYRFSGWYL